MTLMNRIKVIPFLTLSKPQMIEKILIIQKLRMTSLEEARTNKARGRTKSAIKNLKKRKKSINPKADAIKALEKLSPLQQAKLAKMFS